MEYRGLATPVDKSNGGYFSSATLEELLWSSLLLIMTTDKGSMPGRRNFGNNISKFIFEQINSQSIGELQVQIKHVIENNDPRIRVRSVKILNNYDTIFIRISIENKISRQVYEKTFSLTEMLY
jgi:phage baseplate assembly protein W